VRLVTSAATFKWGPWHFHSVSFGFIRFWKMTHPPPLFALKLCHNASFDFELWPRTETDVGGATPTCLANTQFAFMRQL
jgi:hypothetical protein